MTKEPIDFEEELRKIKETLFQILGDEYVNYREGTRKDIETFLDSSKDKLERWTKLLSKKKITLEEYEWLVKSQKELLTFKELEKAGISKMKLGHLKNKAIKAVVNIGKGLFNDIR